MQINDNWATLQYITNKGEVVDFTNRFLINKSGTMLSLFGQKKQKPCLSREGAKYLCYRIEHNNTRMKILVHRAVLSSFYPIDPIFGFLHVAHIDETEDNNHLSNLCWMSQLHNIQQRVGVGRVAVDPDTRIGVFLCDRVRSIV